MIPLRTLIDTVRTLRRVLAGDTPWNESVFYKCTTCMHPFLAHRDIFAAPRYTCTGLRGDGCLANCARFVPPWTLRLGGNHLRLTRYPPKRWETPL